MTIVLVMMNVAIVELLVIVAVMYRIQVGLYIQYKELLERLGERQQ